MPDPEADVRHSAAGHRSARRHVSVRLIRGDLSNNIPEHPVEIHVGGKVQTVKTDDEGRAEFGPRRRARR